LHSPFPDPSQTVIAWRAMESIHAAGEARQLGISNCSLADLEALHHSSTVKPAVVQNRFHAANGYDREVRVFCAQHGIVYQSFWTLTANRDLLESNAIAGLAERYGRTAAQVLFRYLTQHGVVPLTGTTSPVHMLEDLAIFEFALSEEDLGLVSTLLAGGRGRGQRA
jgi:diketogulonate reductase-like aldo/keto reductase